MWLSNRTEEGRLQFFYFSFLGTKGLGWVNGLNPKTGTGGRPLNRVKVQEVRWMTVEGETYVCVRSFVGH